MRARIDFGYAEIARLCVAKPCIALEVAKIVCLRGNPTCGFPSVPRLRGTFTPSGRLCRQSRHDKFACPLFVGIAPERDRKLALAILLAEDLRRASRGAASALREPFEKGSTENFHRTLAAKFCENFPLRSRLRGARAERASKIAGVGTFAIPLGRRPGIGAAAAAAAYLGLRRDVRRFCLLAKRASRKRERKTLLLRSGAVLPPLATTFYF